MIKGIVFDMWGVLIEDRKNLAAGVPQMLEELKGKYQLGVATSIDRRGMNEVLKNLKIKEYFEACSGGSDVEYNKPAADVYLRSMELMGLSPAECVVVEDGADNLIEIGRLGAKTLLIGRDFDEMMELTELIKALNSEL